MPQTSYPGVYIEEFAPAPPIQPASTSVAAFIGVAAGGPINIPTRVTSFNQFVSIYGARPVNGFYLWYALRGFFENGGTDCFVVRASNGAYARNVLNNFDGAPVVKIRTLLPGKPAGPNKIAVTSVEAHRLTSDKLRVFAIPDQPIDPLPPTDPKFDPRTIKFKPVASVHLFRVGDTIQVKDSGEQAVVLSVDAVGKTLRVDRIIPGLDNTKLIRLADVPADSLTITLEYIDPAGPKDLDLPTTDSLTAGTLLRLNAKAGNPADQEFAIVDVVAASFLPDPNPPANPPVPPKRVFDITLRDTLDKGISRDGSVADASRVWAQSEEYALSVEKGATKNQYTFLATDPLHPRYATTIVNAQDPLIRIEEIDPPPAGGPEKLLPVNNASVVLGDAVNIPIVGLKEEGSDETIADLPTSPQVFIKALNSLVSPVDPRSQAPDVDLVAIPDVAAMKSHDDAAGIQQAVIAHCEVQGDRFGVLDAFTPDQDPFANIDQVNGTLPSIQVQRGKLISARGYAALYYPWIRVLPASRGPLVSVPPSGHVCGLFARIDNSRGVHKAPANETLFGAVAITRDMSNVDQGVLNLQNINVIRTFTNGGQPILFGARTTSPFGDPNWQYVNVRRLFLFLEKSISHNLRASVFEPNNTTLWGGLKRTISAFLLEQWHAGAIFGEKPDKAFYVKIDEILNPFTDRQLGKLTIEIGVQPTYPAEFIVVRIGIWDGGSSISEA